VCYNCKSLGKILSKNDTKKKINEHLKIEIKEFIQGIKNYNTRDVVYKFNKLRNKIFPRETYLFRFFLLTCGLGLILNYWSYLNNDSRQIISSESLNDLVNLSQDIYLYKHYLFFTRFDAVRYTRLEDTSFSEIKEGFRFTENWLPIYKRQWLSGSRPSDPDFTLSLNQNLFSGVHYKKIFLEEVHKKDESFAGITNYLVVLQNMLFQYPWSEYLKVGRKIEQIDQFIEIAEKFSKYPFWNPIDRGIFKNNEITYIKSKWISKPEDSVDFPLIIDLENKWIVANEFLSDMKTIYNLFSSKGRRKFAKYQNTIGKELENRIFFDLHRFKLDFNCPLTGKELIRYTDPDNKSIELFDVGAIDRNFKFFYVIECKGKTRLNLRDYDPIRLNRYIKGEFEKFKDRDLPRIKILLKDWNIESYKIIPMFYNIVPLVGEFENFEEHQLYYGMYIIQNFTEIGTIIYMNFMKNNAKFNEIYILPKTFLRIINEEISLNGIDVRIPSDLGNYLNEMPDKYIITQGYVLKYYPKDLIPEIDIKIDDGGYILNIDIPPEVFPEVEKLQIKEGDRVSALFYRQGPYSQAYFLGKIWKL
jgi:hypothetical protein